MLSNKTPLDILESTIKNMGTSSYNKPASSENQAPNDMNSKKSRLKTEKKSMTLETIGCFYAGL